MDYSKAAIFKRECRVYGMIVVLGEIYWGVFRGDDHLFREGAWIPAVQLEGMNEDEIRNLAFEIAVRFCFG